MCGRCLKAGYQSRVGRMTASRARLPATLLMMMDWTALSAELCSELVPARKETQAG